MKKPVLKVADLIPGKDYVLLKLRPNSAWKNEGLVGERCILIDNHFFSFPDLEWHGCEPGFLTSIYIGNDDDFPLFREL